MAMPDTGVGSLDRSIAKASTWITDVGREFGTNDREFAYRVTRAWLHGLRDRLTVAVAAHFAAQLPELLRGVFYDRWNPSHVPVKYNRGEYAARFVRDARVHDSDVGKASRAVTAVARRHMSAGMVDEALALLPADLRELLDAPAAAGKPAGLG